MISTPNLETLADGQVALLFVDPFTGVAVDDAGNWLKDGDWQYTVFDSEDEARAYADIQMQNGVLLECSLVDSLGNQLAVLQNENAIAEKSEAQQKRGFWKRLFG